LERNPAVLIERHQALLRNEPKVRIRDAALRLGVSEAELVAARCGQGVERLDLAWPSLLEGIATLGEVMALTRNDHAVHEKVGRFDGIEVSPGGEGAVVAGPDIDLRLRLSHWRYGYAIAGEPPANRSSLQFFDAAGVAIHKVFLREASDREAYRKLVAAHRSADQRPGETIDAAASPAKKPPRDDSTVDLAAFRARWAGIGDIHEFAGMLPDFGLSRQQAFRLIGPQYAEAVQPATFVSVLESVAESGLPIMVFVSNAAAVQIHTGPVKTLKRIGPWFNVLDPGFNLHLLDGGIASAWVVRKPTRDGHITSLEIFDSADNQIGWVFGDRERNQPEREDWRTLLAGMPRLDGAAR